MGTIWEQITLLMSILTLNTTLLKNGIQFKRESLHFAYSLTEAPAKALCNQICFSRNSRRYITIPNPLHANEGTE